MRTRLGLDIGTNSIGWALLALDDNGSPINIVKMGSRIFPDGRHPKTGTPLAVERRQKRQERRRRDRTLYRKKSLLEILIANGLFPVDLTEQRKLKNLDVYHYRVKALSEQITPYELGRVLLHLNQKRGFKSGRKVSLEDVQNKISDRIQNLQNYMKERGARTYGEYLYIRIRDGQNVKATAETGIYPLRQLWESEVTEIIKSQKQYHKDVSDSQWGKITDVMFKQRPLKAVELGPCSLFYDKKRSYRFLPSFEYYRLLSSLYNLRWFDENFQNTFLTPAQVENVFRAEKYTGKISEKKIKKILGIPDSLELRNSDDKNFETKGCSEAKKFYQILKGKWEELSLNDQDFLALSIYGEDLDYKVRENIESLKKIAAYKRITDSEWNQIMDLTSSQDGTQAFSSEALQRLVGLSLEEHRSPLKVLQDLRRSELYDGTVGTHLEYYGKVLTGRVVPASGVLKDIHGNSKNPAPWMDQDELSYGKIANPTVHVGLRQLQKLVNELIDTYGRPEQVHIELARDLKMSKERKAELAKIKKSNESINKQAEELINTAGVKKNAANMEKAKLWLELKSTPKSCIYSGQNIGQEKLFSDEIEVDHILPFSRTLDDGFGNKVLCYRKYNRDKGNRSPSECWKNDELLEIVDRARRYLPAKKANRFLSEAMSVFCEDNAFIQRQLTDTAYLGKIAKEYLATVIPDASKNICVNPGKLTAIVRSKLGLNRVLNTEGDNRKNRDDNRHHAIDAFVVAIIDRSFLQTMSKASAANDMDRVIVEEPWDGFRRDFEKKVDEITISYKADRGHQGRLMEETAYGPVSMTQLPDRIEAKEILKTTKRDENNKKYISYEKVLGEDLDALGGIDSQFVKIQHGPDGEHVKFYRKSECHHISFWEMNLAVYKAYCARHGLKVKKSDLSKSIHYVAQPVYLYDFNKYKDSYDKYFRPHPAAKLKMKVFKGDVVSVTQKGETTFGIIRSISPSNGVLTFHSLNENKYLKKFSFNVFMAGNPRRHSVSVAGKVR